MIQLKDQKNQDQYLIYGDFKKLFKFFHYFQTSDSKSKNKKLKLKI